MTDKWILATFNVIVNIVLGASILAITFLVAGVNFNDIHLPFINVCCLLLISFFYGLIIRLGLESG